MTSIDALKMYILQYLVISSSFDGLFCPKIRLMPSKSRFRPFVCSFKSVANGSDRIFMKPKLTKTDAIENILDQSHFMTDEISLTENTVIDRLFHAVAKNYDAFGYLGH